MYTLVFGRTYEGEHVATPPTQALPVESCGGFGARFNPDFGDVECVNYKNRNTILTADDARLPPTP